MNERARAYLFDRVIISVHTHIVGGFLGFLMLASAFCAYGAESDKAAKAPDLTELSLEALM